jgi:Fur family transcriptional regulator, zinc uptake regulator
MSGSNSGWIAAAISVCSAYSNDGWEIYVNKDHHHDHDHHGHHDPVADAQAHCAEKGLRLTDMRRHVFEALVSKQQAMGAYDLIDALANNGHKRLAPISVYRALDFLLEAGLAHKIESRNAFVACPHRHATNEVVVFMICEQCNRVQESTSDAVSKSMAIVAQNMHFTPRGQVIEMLGRCASCGPDSVMTA